jgi:hypothetical protein
MSIIVCGAIESFGATTSEILEQSKLQPEALWELKEAPVQEVFEPLRDLWLRNELLVQQRANVKAAGREREWMEMQQRHGIDVDKAAAIFPIALEVLLNHSDIESYIIVQLDGIKNTLSEGPESRRERPQAYAEAFHDHIPLLQFAAKMPGDAAFRIVGSFLDAPHYAPENLGGITVASPAAHATGALQALVKERLNGELPSSDVDAARTWWTENSIRFARKPEPSIGAQNVAVNDRTSGRGLTEAAQSLVSKPVPLTVGTICIAGLIVLLWRVFRPVRKS